MPRNAGTTLANLGIRVSPPGVKKCPASRQESDHEYSADELLMSVDTSGIIIDEL